MKKIILLCAALLLCFCAGFTGCEKMYEETKLKTLEGVNLKTEYGYYAEGTAQIRAFWQNNTENALTFGNSWSLQKYDTAKDKWAIVGNTKDIAFTSIGYLLFSGGESGHTYDITIYTKNIKAGLYRIKTHFDYGGTQLHWQDRMYDITAEFTVTKNDFTYSVSSPWSFYGIDKTIISLISDGQELAAWQENMLEQIKGLFGYSHNWYDNDIAALRALSDIYNDTFFETQDVVFLYFPASSGGDRFEIEEVNYKNEIITVKIKQTAFGVTCDMGYWFFAIGFNIKFPPHTSANVRCSTNNLISLR